MDQRVYIRLLPGEDREEAGRVTTARGGQLTRFFSPSPPDLVKGAAQTSSQFAKLYYMKVLDAYE